MQYKFNKAHNKSLRRLRRHIWKQFAYGSLRTPRFCLRQPRLCHPMSSLLYGSFDLCSHVRGPGGHVVWMQAKGDPAFTLASLGLSARFRSSKAWHRKGCWQASQKHFAFQHEAVRHFRMHGYAQGHQIIKGPKRV